MWPVRIRVLIVPLRVKTERESPKRALACHEVTQYLSQDHDLTERACHDVPA